MNSEFPELTTAWHFRVRSPARPVELTFCCQPWNKIPCHFPNSLWDNFFAFYASTEPTDWNSAFHSSFLNWTKPFSMGTSRMLETPSCLHGLSLVKLFVSCCFDFTGTVEPLRSLTFVSFLQCPFGPLSLISSMEILWDNVSTFVFQSLSPWKQTCLDFVSLLLAIIPSFLSPFLNQQLPPCWLHQPLLTLDKRWRPLEETQTCQKPISNSQLSSSFTSF